MSEIFLTKTKKLATVVFVVCTLILALANIVNAQAPGDLDPTFNNTGVVTYTTGVVVDGGYAVALQEDGKILSTGCSAHIHDGTCDITVVRFNSDGSLDTDFNGTGVVTTPATIGINGGTSIAIQPNDGKIVVAGEGTDGVGSNPPNPYNEIVLVRYETDGSLDLSLRGTGFFTTSVSDWDDRGRAVAIQPQDGKIVVAGEASRSNSSDTEIAVVRYNNDGNLDLSFSDDGMVTTPVGNTSTASSVALQSDGKIVVAGWYNWNSYFVVARYTVSGTLDTEFSDTGLATGEIQGRAYAVALQSDGKIIVAGTSEHGNIPTESDFVVARYLTNGDLDPDFGTAGTGIVTTSVSSTFDGAIAATIQEDGKIVVAGYSNQYYTSGFVTNSDFTVVRYTSDGDLDTTFHRTGIVTTPIASSNINSAMGVAIQPDGNIVAAGATLTRTLAYTPDIYFTTQDFMVVRYIGAFAHSTYVPVILKDD